MSSGPQSPVNRWFLPALAGSVLVAALCGWGFYRGRIKAQSVAALSDHAREELAALTIPALKSAEVERGWVADSDSGYFIAPVGPMPCEPVTGLVPPVQQPVVRSAWISSQQADDDVRIEQLADINASHSNLLVVQMLGTALVEGGLYADAERVLAQGLAGTDEDERIIDAARKSASLDFDDPNISTVIHLHHALGVARLNKSLNEPPWISLKNVIGSLKPLPRRRMGGTSADSPVASRLLIPAPGCKRGEGRSLSSYDLYSNLIVAYMNGNFQGAELERNKEFARPRRDRRAPLQAMLVGLVAQARRTSVWKNESQLWALSNVEQVVDQRIPDDARIAYNSVRVIDWWKIPEHCPAEICTPELLGQIDKVRNDLIRQAFKRPNVAEDQQESFARAMLRLLVMSSIKRSEVAESAARVGKWLPEAEQTTLNDLIAADVARAELPKFLFAKPDGESEDPAQPEPESKEPPEAKLGARAEKWRAAAMTDFASVAATWAATRPPNEQRAVISAIRQLLGGAEAPPQLLALENNQGWLRRVGMRLNAAKPLWAFIGLVIAVAVWLVLVWLLVHLRERMLLRASLYNVELRHLARMERR